MKDYSDCTPREFKLMILAQLELASDREVMVKCVPYFRTVLEEVEETIEKYNGMISEFEEQIRKVRGHLLSNDKPRNSLRLNGLILMDKTASQWLEGENKKLNELRENLKSYEEVHEMFMMHGI
ncbi:hypothetical protein [Vibrio coralliilyticus]|uniref:hypothetical protein n=1 Tax=Vibrio coralliilyticus TaxID=190893 RepID=UPI00185DECF0|nr:hypothetical protein [Vibrio coralliilyticus]NUW69911.1 hypothetical protein [Vibrio coralliilyticus]